MLDPFHFTFLCSSTGMCRKQYSKHTTVPGLFRFIMGKIKPAIFLLPQCDCDFLVKGIFWEALIYKLNFQAIRQIGHKEKYIPFFFTHFHADSIVHPQGPFVLPSTSILRQHQHRGIWQDREVVSLRTLGLAGVHALATETTGGVSRFLTHKSINNSRGIK
jgi:hypothetical protein